MEKLSPEEVKVLIKASQIAKKKGIKKGASVKEICEKAGVSRKTGYQWVNEASASSKDNKNAMQKLVHQAVDHQKLLNKYADLRIENEGLRLAMEIHGFDEMIQKKTLTKKDKS